MCGKSEEGTLVSFASEYLELCVSLCMLKSDVAIFIYPVDIINAQNVGRPSNTAKLHQIDEEDIKNGKAGLIKKPADRDFLPTKPLLAGGSRYTITVYRMWVMLAIRFGVNYPFGSVSMIFYGCCFERLAVWNNLLCKY